MPEKMCGPITGLPIRSANPAGTSQASSKRPSLRPISIYWPDLGGGRFVDHRPHVGAGVGRVADHQCPRRFDQPAQERIMDAVQGDHAAARRTLLAAVAKGRLPDGQHGLVEIGRFIDDDRVLAAHLADDFLDEGLAGLRVGRPFSGSAGRPPSSP